MTSPTRPSRGSGPDGLVPAAWPWRLLVISLAGLLAGVVLASLVALSLTLSVSGVAERTLLEDVALEDEAEDVHVAVLDLGTRHQALVLAGPTRAARADHAAAVTRLREELAELAALGVRFEGTLAPAEQRAVVDAYEAELASVLDDTASTPIAVDQALDFGLERLERLEREASALDVVGTVRASDALRRLGDATDLASSVLLASLIAIGIASAALTVLGLRVLRELRRLSAAERRAAADVRDLLRTRTEFIADASHELRTPITVLRGTAEVGARLEPLDCAHVPILREITAEAVRMSRLVEELLFLARHDAGVSDAEPEEVALEALAADLNTRAEALCRQRGIGLSSREEVAGSAWLDPGRIEQATMILVDNASKHAPQGSAVELAVGTHSDDLVISVLDHGPGIAPAVREHVFDRFRRAERSRRSSEGVGLGLAIARAIAEDHGGTIALVDPPAGGTQMTMRIPLLRERPLRPPGSDSPAL